MTLIFVCHTIPEPVINKYLSSVEQIYRRRSNIVFSPSSRIHGYLIFECISALLVKWTVRYKGSSLVGWAPRVRCRDHHELDPKPRSCRYRFLSQTRNSRE
jgi:hypothetical protein